MRTTRRSRSLTSSLEHLEARIAPAGLVTLNYDAKTGVLQMNGDGQDNGFSIYRTGPASFRIAGDSSTMIHSVAETFFDLGKLTSVLINGGGGIDAIRFEGVTGLTTLSLSAEGGSLSANGLGVKGSVDLNGGASSNSYSFFGNTVIGGNLTINDIAGTNGFQTGDNFRVTGAVNYHGGTGDEVVRISAFSAGKGFYYDGAAGVSDLEVSGAFTLGKGADGVSLRMQGTGGLLALINAASVSMTGYARFDSGAASTVQVKSAGVLKISGRDSDGESIVYHATANGDTMIIDGPTMTLAGGILFDAKDGTNTFNLGTATSTLRIGAATGGVSVAMTGGPGTDHLYILASALTAAGGIEFAGDGGFNDATIYVLPGATTIGKSTLGRSLSLSATGTGYVQAALNLTKGNLAGGIRLDPGTGSGEVEFDGYVSSVTVGKEAAQGHSLEILGTSQARLGGSWLSFTGGISVEAPAAPAVNSQVVPLASNFVIGKSLDGTSVNFTAPTGDHYFGETDTDYQNYDSGSILMRGALKFAGGPAVDAIGLSGVASLTIPSIDFHGGGGNNTVDLGARIKFALGSITVTGDAGADTFKLAGDGTVTGNVSIDLGSATVAQSVSLTAHSRYPGSLKLGGTLTVRSATVAAKTESLTLTNVTVAKDVLFVLGEADSTVVVDNLFASGAFTVQTNGGVDSVQIERASLFGGSIFRKAVNIDLGAGNDSLRVGRTTPDNKAAFLAAVILAGGAGDDTFNMNLPQQNSFKTVPSLAFEFPVND